MTTSSMWPWAALLLLGALHGLNPGMGWLFAVALGLQERSAGAVWRALTPLAVGHAVAMVTALAALAAVSAVLPVDHLRWIVATGLVAVAVRSVVRHRHLRWRGMRVGARDLGIWSFFMASAHGAGLMALPFVLALSSRGEASATVSHHGHLSHDATLAQAGAMMEAPPFVSLVAVLLHTAGYVVVTAVLAVIVYERVGLRMLRTAWINLDLIWALVLIVAAVGTVLL